MRLGGSTAIKKVWHGMGRAAELRLAGQPSACPELVEGAPVPTSIFYNFHFRRGFQQTARVGMLRPFSNLLSGSNLDNFSAIHYGDSGCEIANYWHGMRDEKIGKAEFPLQFVPAG